MERFPMLLDAPTFTLNLTPEAALSVIQKEIAKRGWKEWEVQEIRLVYVPYYVFSFDVIAEGGQQPSGKVAINANTGEIDEFVPALLDRPLTRTKSTDAQAKPEVESTNISRSDIERVGAVKVAASVGLKKENISVAAVAKYYFPFYRTWINVGGEKGDSYTINVDALMGSPLGLEAVASKHRSWAEETEFTLDRLKTPSGWMELIGSIPALFTSGTGPMANLLGSKTGRWVVLGVAALILFLFVFRGASITSACAPNLNYVGSSPPLGLSFLGPATVVPARRPDGTLFVRGTCSFTSSNSNDVTACERVEVMENGQHTTFINNTCVIVHPSSSLGTEKEFTLNFPAGPAGTHYSLDFSTQVLG